MKWIVWLAILLAWQPTWAQIRVVDDAGIEVVLEQPARRIVSLAPHATEMLFAVGAGQWIVAATEYSDFPEAAKAIPRVGGYSTLDMERIVAARPDLIVVWHSGNGEGVAERLRALGMTVYMTEPTAFDDIATNMERLALLADVAEAGRAAAAEFRKQLDELNREYSHRKPVTVFYQIWNQPLMTVNGEHLISKLMALCGGRNIFADLPTLAPQVNTEAVLLANPQVIIASGMAAERPEWLDEWQRWPRLEAVAGGHIYTIHPDWIQRQGPRIIKGGRIMCEYLERARH